MKISFLIMFLIVSSSFAESKGILAKWKTIDDETGKPKSIVEIYRDGDVIHGRILDLINPTEPNPLCDVCKGDKLNKPIKGMEILWGMKETKKGQEWKGGEILDPNNGKTYNCKLSLKEDGEKLDVRGFIGISLLGRTQTWLREK